MVQIENVILKGKDDSLVLAMREDYLTNGTYEYLASGYYDNSSMNLFAGNVDEMGDWGLLDYTILTPTDYYHPADGNNTPKFIGRRFDTTGDHECCRNNVLYHFSYYTQHFFFIRTRDGFERSQVGTGCSEQVNGCTGEFLNYF